MLCRQNEMSSLCYSRWYIKLQVPFKGMGLCETAVLLVYMAVEQSRILWQEYNMTVSGNNMTKKILHTKNDKVDCVWNVMAHAQKTDFVFRRNGRVHLNRRGCQFSRLLAAEVCASAVVMLDIPCSEEVWRVLATHSIRQFLLHFPSRASSCANIYQLESTISNRSTEKAVQWEEWAWQGQQQASGLKCRTVVTLSKKSCLPFKVK